MIFILATLVQLVNVLIISTGYDDNLTILLIIMLLKYYYINVWKLPGDISGRKDIITCNNLEVIHGII